MPVHTVWLINKAGGLVYQRSIDDSFHPKMSLNDCLVLASTFQSIHAISAKVSPIAGSGGIRHLELLLGSAPFRLHSLQSPTGIKILMTTTLDKRLADPLECERLLRRIYTVYADYALKNPFQAPEMPIKSDAFDSALLKTISSSS